MKIPFIKTQLALGLLLLQTSTHAETGNLFNVSSSGQAATVNFILCLNASAELSCQTYTASALSLNISTIINNHVYPNAGIKVVTPDYAAISGCTPLENGFCAFSANDHSNANVIINSNNPVLFTGYYSDGSNQFPLSYTSNTNGDTWTLSSPLPMLPSGATSGGLYSATCNETNTLCVGVGSYSNGSLNLPLVETSTNGGKNWALGSSLSIPVGATENTLSSVSCGASRNACVAVGSTYNGSNNTAVAYYSSNGGNTWTLVSTLPISATDSSLTSVNCNSAGNLCVTAGQAYNGTTNMPLFLTSSNGGSSWTQGSASTGSLSADNFYLSSVACDSAGKNCLAVGSYNNGSMGLPLVFTTSNSGTSWLLINASELPLPLGATQAALYSISCDTSATICSAVGSSFNGTVNTPYILYTNNAGISWNLASPQPTLPLGATTGYLDLVKCNSTGSACTAGGAYTNGSNYLPLTYTTNNAGITWTLSSQQPSLPSGAVSGSIGQGVS